MMTDYSLASALWQTVLLVISQFVLVSLGAGTVLLFYRKCKLGKQTGMGAVFVLNAALYILMQLDSRLTGAGQGPQLHVPCGLLLAVILLSAAYGALAVLGETRNRKVLSHASIKEAFDNLPTGVCFFNDAGLPVLCNRAMQRFRFAVCGADVQYITDLENCLAPDFLPADTVHRDGNIFVLGDGSAWQLEKKSFTHENGESYTQYTAADVTELYKSRVELTKENAQLRRVQAELQQLSANVVAVTREEEILNAKMRVHDEMGKCLVAARKYLQEDRTEGVPDTLAAAWQRAVSMLKYSNDTPDEDMLLQIRETCDYVKLAFIQTGSLPKQERVAYLLTCAVRECVTNAVRYAQATELYARFSENEREATVTVTNNGRVPREPIVEGGGLSTLRRRVERSGGIMTVQSFPEFKLTVTVPKGKERIL